jgi:hypothetical protein
MEKIMTEYEADKKNKDFKNLIDVKGNRHPERREELDNKIHNTNTPPKSRRF